MASEFYDRIYSNPIIAAIDDLSRLELAIKSPCEIIFLLNGDIFNLKSVVDQVKEAGKLIFVHLDLIDGFSKDPVSLKYINEKISPDGIITTKSNLIKKAKEMNLFAIQRLFMLDSMSLEKGISSVKSTKPDAVEILPGIMHKITKKICEEVDVPVITGGLIQNKDDVILSIKAGAIAISTTRQEAWYM